MMLTLLFFDEYMEKEINKHSHNRSFKIKSIDTSFESYRLSINGEDFLRGTIWEDWMIDGYHPKAIRIDDEINSRFEILDL